MWIGILLGNDRGTRTRRLAFGSLSACTRRGVGCLENFFNRHVHEVLSSQVGGLFDWGLISAPHPDRRRNVSIYRLSHERLLAAERVVVAGVLLEEVGLDWRDWTTVVTVVRENVFLLIARNNVGRVLLLITRRLR